MEATGVPEHLQTMESVNDLKTKIHELEEKSAAALAAAKEAAEASLAEQQSLADSDKAAIKARHEADMEAARKAAAAGAAAAAAGGGGAAVDSAFSPVRARRA